MSKNNKITVFQMTALLFCFFCTTLQCVSQSNLSFNTYRQHDNHLCISCKDKNTKQKYELKVTFPFSDVVNLRLGPVNQDNINHNAKLHKFLLEEQKNRINLLTDDISVKIDKTDLSITVYRNPGIILFQSKVQVVSHPEKEQDVLELQNVITPNEKLFGFGERLNGFNQMGNRIIMELGDCWCQSGGCSYKSIPFYYSSRVYAFLANSSKRFIFDVGNTDSKKLKVIAPDKQMDFYIFGSRSPVEIMKQYTTITGRSPIIPDWTLEPWISRRSKAGWDNPKTVKKEVDAMSNYGMHFGVVLWEGIRSRFGKFNNPSTSDIVNDFHRQGMKVISWDNTGHIIDNERNRKKYGYTDPKIKKYFVQDKNGDFLKITRGGDVYNPDMGSSAHIYIDVSNPEAMDWWLDKVLGSRIYNKKGKSSSSLNNLDGIKLDFSESFPYDTSLFEMNNLQQGPENLYPVLYGQKVNEWLQENKPDGGTIWQRGGGLGIQTVGPVWNGDRMRNYSQLCGTLESLLSASVSGIALIGHDLGGYMSGDNPYAPEVYMRGVQLATFSPFFHDHGSAHAPWEQTKYGMDNYAFYTRVRYNIMPYLSQLVKEAHQVGLPMMRPLFFHHPDDENSWNIADEYYLGHDLLIAPFVSTGNIREIYLPEGDWIDLWDNSLYKGGETIVHYSDLNSIPVFVKEKSVLPLALNNRLELGGDFKHTEKDNLLLTFDIFTQSHQLFSYKDENEITIDYHPNDSIIRIHTDGVNENIGFIVHCNVPDLVAVSNQNIKYLNKNLFSKENEGWMYDHLKNELKIKITNKTDINEFTCRIQGEALLSNIYAKGNTICKIPKTSTPKIIAVKKWNESVDIFFERDNDLSSTYIVNYEYAKYIKHPAGLGNSITISGLKQNKFYSFLLWEENQFNTSIEAPAIRVELTEQKSPVFEFENSYLFIKANHFTLKKTIQNDSMQYTYTVNNHSEATNVHIWGKIEKNINIHNQYPRWYPLNKMPLKKGLNKISISIPEQYDILKIYLTNNPEDWPFFIDATNCSYINLN